MTGSDQQIAGSFAGELGAVARDIVRYAGRRGIVAVLFVALGATLEGLSLALIVPLLAIVTGAGTSSDNSKSRPLPPSACSGLRRPSAGWRCCSRCSARS